MKEKELSLSDKLYAGSLYKQKDVKEFIRLLKEEICRYRDTCAKLYCNNCFECNKINKIFGDKLTEGEE